MKSTNSTCERNQQVLDVCHIRRLSGTIADNLIPRSFSGPGKELGTRCIAGALRKALAKRMQHFS